MLASSLWRSFQSSLQKKSSKSRRQRRVRSTPHAAQSWSAEVLESRLLLSSVLVDTTPISTISGTEGSPATNVVLMTFTDDNADAQAADFSVTSVDWGTTTVGTTPTAQVVVDPNYSGVGSGWMVVVDTVTFGDVGTYTAALTVQADGSDVSSANTSILVADALLSDTTPATGFVQVFGTPTTNVTLMTFTDANPFAASGDFSVTNVDWGSALSGTAPTVTVVSDSSYTGAGSGWKVVADSVTFADPGHFTVTVSVQDVDGGTVDSSTLEVQVAGLTDTSPGSTIGATQGAATNNAVLMTFTSTDPDAQAGDFTASNLNWGGTLSGTTPTLSVVVDPDYTGTGTGWKVVANSVTYVDVGTHAISLTVTDHDGISTTSAVTKFSVGNALLADTTPDMNANSWTGVASANAIVMTFTDANPDSTASQYSIASIDYGATPVGTTPTVSIVTNPNYSGPGKGWMVVVESLTYADAGQYVVSVTVQDEAGDPVSTANVTFDIAVLVLSSHVNRLPATTEGTPADTDYVVNESTKLWELTAASAALTAPTTSFVVSWAGSANAVKYTIYYSDNGAAFVPFVTDTTATSATFNGAVIGHNYAFYSVATDVEGNLETSSGAADTSTTVDTLSAYAREAGLEGYYFVNGEWAQVLRNGTAVTLIDGAGQSSIGTITSETNIVAGDLEGTYDRDEATITFADGSLWEQARQIAGRWLTNGRAEVGIQQLGIELTFKNAQAATSTGYFTSADEIVATDWGLTGKLTSHGTRIRWSDGTYWDLIPELEGATANASGNPNRVEQFGATLTFTNRFGESVSGLFIGQNQVMAPDWGNIIGTLKNGAIYWANGTIWTRQNLSSTNPDLGGLWDVNGFTLRIMQTNSVLTFVNKDGGSSTGSFVSPTLVVANDWGGIQGTLSGNMITWTNGSVWTKLPDLAGTYLNASNQGTGVNQLGRSLTLTDAQGTVSHATLTSPTTIQENDGQLRTATISGATITFSDGTVWTRLADLQGNWSLDSDHAPTRIEQSLTRVLFVTSTGTILKGTFSDPTHLSLTEEGVSNAPAIAVEQTSNTLLTFDDESEWERTPLDSLDRVFANLNMWPHL